MSGSALPQGGPDFYRGDRDGRHWLAVGFAVLAGCIGIAILLAFAVPILRGQTPTWVTATPGWDWIGGLIGLLIALLVLSWIVRLIVWGFWGRPHYGAYWRHHYRHYWPGEPGWGDPALQIARERLARGEITQDQFDQIMSRLGKSPTTGPPG